MFTCLFVTVPRHHWCSTLLCCLRACAKKHKNTSNETDLIPKKVKPTATEGTLAFYSLRWSMASKAFCTRRSLWESSALVACASQVQHYHNQTWIELILTTSPFPNNLFTLRFSRNNITRHPSKFIWIWSEQLHPRAWAKQKVVSMVCWCFEASSFFKMSNQTKIVGHEAKHNSAAFNHVNLSFVWQSVCWTSVRPKSSSHQRLWNLIHSNWVPSTNNPKAYHLGT